MIAQMQHAYFSRHRTGLLIVAFSAAAALAMGKAAAAGLSFGGVPVAPGESVRANVPLSAQEKRYAAEARNPVPNYAVAVIAVPRTFNPQESWPVLVVISTSDGKRQSRDDLAEYYQAPALGQGWVILAGDGPQPARVDGTAWRAGMTLAALDSLHRSFPGSISWPVACAGFSGGAKGVAFIAPLLRRAGCRTIGLYLTGAFDDYLSKSYQEFQPGADFLNTPVFISAGRDDRIAPLDKQYELKRSMERSGFRQVRMETFTGGHDFKDYHLIVALRWFRELQKAR
jgi:pimeloyl-ACP methyl ester carboxylesterase